MINAVIWEYVYCGGVYGSIMIHLVSSTDKALTGIALKTPEKSSVMMKEKKGNIPCQVFRY